jgi:hypothetical protein
MELMDDYRGWEFILVTEEHQKKLNQWRHKYYIRIFNIIQAESGLSILLARKEIRNECGI